MTPVDLRIESLVLNLRVEAIRQRGPRSFVRAENTEYIERVSSPQQYEAPWEQEIRDSVKESARRSCQNLPGSRRYEIPREKQLSGALNP